LKPSRRVPISSICISEPELWIAQKTDEPNTET
jgi:hypothetical protein